MKINLYKSAKFIGVMIISVLTIGIFKIVYSLKNPCNLAERIAQDIEKTPTHWKRVSAPLIKNPFREQGDTTSSNYILYEIEIEMARLSDIGLYFQNDSLGVVLRDDDIFTEHSSWNYYNLYFPPVITIIKPETLELNKKDSQTIGDAISDKIEDEKEVAHKKEQEQEIKSDEANASKKCELTYKIFKK